MTAVPPSKKYGKIAIVLDDRLQRAQKGILTRLIHTFRTFANIDILGETIQESQVLGRLQHHPCDLLLLPWHAYLNWKKVEAFYGTTRNFGPTVAGYFCEPLSPETIVSTSDYSRLILLDFCALGHKESGILVRNLLEDSRRCGIRPFLRGDYPVWSENWYHGQGLGMRLDSIFSLPELVANDWNSRAHAIRTLIVAFWGLIYEEGPGKSEFRQAIAGNRPIANFQVAFDERTALFRLCFQLPGTTMRSLLEKFWHDPKMPGSAAQYLLRYADFVRVHQVSESPDVEVVAGLFHSCAAERMSQSLHTLWIEPVAPSMMSEAAFVEPGPEFPYLRVLPEAPLSMPRSVLNSVGEANERAANRAKDRYILEAAQKIRELRGILDEREAAIRELRSGGIGTSRPTAPADPESLIEAFQARYFEFKHRLRQFEHEIAQLQSAGGSAEELEGLRRRIAQMGERERSWIQALAKTVAAYTQGLKAGTKGSSGGSGSGTPDSSVAGG